MSTPEDLAATRAEPLPEERVAETGDEDRVAGSRPGAKDRAPAFGLAQQRQGDDERPDPLTLLQRPGRSVERGGEPFGR